MAATNGGASTPATAGGATQAAKSALVVTGAYARVRPHVRAVF